MIRLMRMTTTAALVAPADFARFLRCVRTFGRMRDRVHNLHRWLPLAGRRWDVIYFPWINGAIIYWPLFDGPASVVVSCRGRQINIEPHVDEGSLHAAGRRAAFGRAAMVHCVSEAILKEAEPLGLSREKAVVIRPAVDPEVFRPLESRSKCDGEFIVVTTGSLIWLKGMEYALCSIRKLRDRGVNVRFEIIGEGPDRQRVLYTIHDLGLQDSVVMLGRLPPSEVCARLQQADAFLLSSVSEGISNAVLEAMACGLPVVTTNCGGMNEAVTDGVEGFVVPTRNPEAMAVSLLKLALEPGLHQQMGQAGRARILREFTLQRQINDWLALFDTVMSARSGCRSVAHSLPVSESP
jgi:glycosyltransferase involved in cell wall biosynthesis